MMKVIVAGSRSFNDLNYLFNKMNEIFNHPKENGIEIVTGKAEGADTLGEYWASHWGLKIHEFPADWDKHGKSAGYTRNKEMAEVANILVAFWDGRSKGTSNMIAAMNKLNKQCHVYTDWILI